MPMPPQPGQPSQGGGGMLAQAAQAAAAVPNPMEQQQQQQAAPPPPAGLVGNHGRSFQILSHTMTRFCGDQMPWST